MAVKQTVCSLLSHFPPVEFAFAYGSAAFKQHGRDLGKMLDLILVVSNSESWHENNMKQNKSHYSCLRTLGPSFIAKIQRQPAGLYYNTLIQMDSQLIKYGVMSYDDFYKDITEWEWLYTSGRLHKPVITINKTTGDKKVILAEALKYNLESSLLCSLLLLNKQEVTEWELFLQITGLSYIGDFRMTIGEDKNKVYNVLLPIVDKFRTLYYPIFNKYLYKTSEGKSNTFIVKIGLSVNDYVSYLPAKLRSKINNGKSLQEAIRSIVIESSRKQAIKGIVTAGGKKTIIYTGQKLRKMFRSMS